MTISKAQSRTSLRDSGTGITAGVETVLGKNRLLVDSNISSVNVPLGKDPLPDMFFSLINAGNINDTIRIQVAGKTDPNCPERDLPAVDVTYTTVLEDTQSCAVWAQNIVDTLKADANFENAFLDSDFITETERLEIHITSTKFSLNGEWFERATAGDVSVTTTGDAEVQIDTSNEVLVSRAKEVSLGRDPNNPHRLGVQAISGTVTRRATDLDSFLRDFAESGGNTDMAVNPAGGSEIFTIAANTAGGQRKVVEAIRFSGNDGNIKVGETNFLGLNSALTNGIIVRFIKDGNTQVFQNIMSTDDLLNIFPTTPADSRIIPSSGNDSVVSVFSFIANDTQLELEPGTTDRIEIEINDNLSQVSNLFFLAIGFQEDE